MPTATYGINLTVGGISISKSIPRTGNHPNPYEVTLPKGYSGTLTTRTDNDTGTATMGAGHGITTGMVVDVYWATGVRRGMTVGSVSGNSVPLDLGTGDNLPSTSTALVVSPQVSIDTAIDGDDALLIGLCAEFSNQQSTDECYVNFLDSDSVQVTDFTLVANSPRVYDIDGGGENPFSGNPIVLAEASNRSTAANATLKILSMEEA